MEEVNLYKNNVELVEYGAELQTVNSCHRMEEYSRGVDAAEEKTLALIRHYDIDCTVASNFTFDFLTKCTIRSRVEGATLIGFELSKRLEVDRVLIGTDTASFYRFRNLLYINLKKPLMKGEERLITLVYKGIIMSRKFDYVFFEIDPSSWYPQSGYLNLSTFDLTFHVPTSLKFVSAGELVSRRKNGEIETSVWKIATQSIHTSFSIGIFSEKTIKEDDLPPVTLMYGRESTQQSGVIDDIKLSLNFYKKLFGSIPFTSMTGVDLYASHGQAFPNFVHLSYLTFIDPSSSGWEGDNDYFVAHEIAHTCLDFAWLNYHDQWMSEAMAEYLSWMFAQTALQNNKQFFKILTSYKKKIIERQRSATSTRPEAGPMWLGGRLSYSEKTAGDYSLIVYEKGAWVLHMLRNMMIDLNSMNEDKFLAMLKEFRNTYLGKAPTTEQFQQIAEKYAGRDLTWFFKAWVYGTKIPKYTVSYKSASAADGKFKVTMRVKTEHVPADFQMTVPLRVDFGDQGHVNLRTVIAGNDSQFDLPLLPMKPTDIEFNIFESVLCEVEKADWK